MDRPADLRSDPVNRWHTRGLGERGVPSSRCVPFDVRDPRINALAAVADDVKFGFDERRSVSRLCPSGMMKRTGRRLLVPLGCRVLGRHCCVDGSGASRSVPG